MNKLMKPRPSKRQWCALLLALVPSLLLAAPAVYPVRQGTLDAVFGKNAADFAFSYSHAKARQLAPFVEAQANRNHPDAYSGGICCHRDGFDIVLYSIGEKKEKIEDCGGSFSIQIHPGMVNTSTGAPPVVIRFTMERFPSKPPAVPCFLPIVNENEVVRSEPVRVSFGTPSYGSRNVRILPEAPETRFFSLPNGWALVFSFKWVGLSNVVPFREGEFPTSWRMIVERTRPDGTTASWGSLKAPAILSWGRPGDAFANSISINYFTRVGVGKTYRDTANFLKENWSTYKTEKWMGHLDMGVPTFEPKNPESDDIFFSRIVEPIFEGNENIEKAIISVDHAPPPVASFSKAERTAVLQRLDELLFMTEIIDEARRDYLLARFLDQPVHKRSVPKAAKPKKLEKLDPNQDLSTDDLCLDGGDDAMLIDLDDIAF